MRSGQRVGADGREARVLHPQWFEDTLLKHLLERLSRQLLDDEAQQDVGGVGVAILCVRIEIRFVIVEGNRQQLVMLPHALRGAVQGFVERRVLAVVEQTTAHIQQQLDSYLVAIRDVWPKLRYRVSQIQSAFVKQLKDDRCSHRLGDTGDPPVVA